MARYIIHPGTGTILDVDDGCIVVDGDHIDGDLDSDADLDDACAAHGIPLAQVIDASRALPRLISDNDRDLGPATVAQHAASLAAGDTGLIWIEADGTVIADGAWATLQPGARRVWVLG